MQYKQQKISTNRQKYKTRLSAHLTANFIKKMFRQLWLFCFLLLSAEVFTKPFNPNDRISDASKKIKASSNKNKMIFIEQFFVSNMTVDHMIMIQ